MRPTQGALCWMVPPGPKLPKDVRPRSVLGLPLLVVFATNPPFANGWL